MPAGARAETAEQACNGRLPAMKKLLRALAALLIVALLAAAGLLAVALQGEPAVVMQQQPGLADAMRAMALLRAHDPRQAAPGRASAVQLNERDVELLLNHAARGRLDAAINADFERGAAVVRASLHLGANPFGRWLNLEARLAQTGGLPVLESLHAGRLPVPVRVGEWLLRQAVLRQGLTAEVELASQVVRHVIFNPQQLVLVYAWPPGSAARLLQALVPAEQQQRLQAYNERLATVAAKQPPGWTAPLVAFIGPLFELAQQRTRDGGVAATENRAALIVLTLYVNGRGVDTLVPAAGSWPRARPLRLTLGGREDFPQHLLVSAALASEGTGPLSKVMGVYKEVADSRGGSGFSFNDMAANRAGTRIGEMAVQQPGKLQSVLARGVAEVDILPPWQDLPEFMGEPEFLRRFGGVGAPPYMAMLDEIDRRIDALPVLH